jgi:hypothetical protein
MTPPLPIDRVLRGVTLAAVGALGVLGLASDSIVVGGTAWLGFALFALSGLGFFAVRAGKLTDVDFGLRAAWGVAVYLGLAGVLIAVGLLARPAVLALAAVGFAGFAWRELVTADPLWKRAAAGIAFARERPTIALVAIIVIAGALFHVVGAVAQLDRNPWDDDVAYTPLVRRLLDTGNLVEPFSYRRLGAYGGQTALQALLAARGSFASVNALDKGLCFALVMLLVTGSRIRGVALALIALVVLTLPDTSINTASEWSGVAMFVALYRTIARTDDARRFALAGLVGVAACTLRQTYIPVVAIFFVATLAMRRDARAWRAVIVAAAAILPWWIAAWESSRTFLFPFIEGNWNHGLSLQKTAYTWFEELELLVYCCIETAPIVIVQPLFVLAAFTEDTRRGRPLTALFVATVVGFVLLVHAFSTADAASMWRYAFGYSIALAIVFALETADDSDAVRLPPIGRWAVLASLLLQLVVGHARLPKQFATMWSDIAEASRGDPTASAEQQRYAAMQAAVPAGERLAVMLDDPAYLDYKRNPIANLDTPGWVSPEPQMPSFLGAPAMRAYLLNQNIRYVAFVRPDRARYFFRREFWVQRIFTDAEVFQAMSAYVIDAIDTMTALAGSLRPVYDADGLVVLDLGQMTEFLPVTLGDERTRRGAWVRQLADDLGMHDAWSLNPRADVVFGDGFSPLTFVDASAEPKWFEVADRPAGTPTHGTPVRWMHRRNHVRVRGNADMHLVLRGKVNINAVFARPHVDVSLDGALLASPVAGDDGHFEVDVVVPEAQLDGWCDLYIVLATVGEPEKDIKDLRAAWLESFEWEPNAR